MTLEEYKKVSAELTELSTRINDSLDRFREELINLIKSYGNNVSK